MISTSKKILIARGLSSTVMFFRRICGLPSDIVVTRRGLTWSLNLEEGVDFAIYLLGGFEVRTLRLYAQLVREGDVVLDIGANIGAHTVPLAQLVGSNGKVFSFEPTAYAFGKQQTNIALNPKLAPRIRAHQMMLMAGDTEYLPEAVYSSWPLENAEDLHTQHHGRLMPTVGAVKSTLDSFLNNVDVDKINFIKLDVDGNETDVLTGAINTLRQFKPLLMLELAPYVYEHCPQKFDEMLRMLWDLGYSLSEMTNGKLIPRNATDVRKAIPAGCGINILAKVNVKP
jgi:FkbM family methyltransferase